MKIETTPLPASWPESYPLHRAVVTSEARRLDREASQRFSLPPLLLMERAALGVAHVTQLWAPRGPGLVLAGPGDNGGDGYGAARQLAGWGREVEVLDLATAPAQGEAARTQRALCASVLRIERVPGDLDRLAHALQRAAWVVDALFGIGLERPLDAAWCATIDALTRSARPVLSVDVPSGLHADRGLPQPIAVHAEVTATMAAPKPGLLAPSPGARYAGRVVEIDIGLPWALHAPYLRP